jgi:hypothetical protein
VTLCFCAANFCAAKLANIINDRKILEFLLSHNGREVLRKDGIAGLADFWQETFYCFFIAIKWMSYLFIAFI